jgi:hypothetical protein
MMARLLMIALWSVAAVSIRAQSPSAPVKPLASHPLADRVWLGTFGGQVEVNPRSELTAIRTGGIEWRFADGAEIQQGAAVAHGGAEKIRQSANQLALDESALAVKLKSAEWAHAEKTAGLERQMEEIETRIAKLALSPKERELLGGDLSLRLAQERRKAEGQLAALREKLDPAFRAEELRLEQQQLRQDLELAREEHLELIQTMEIPAPHDGILQILKTGQVRANDVIGTVERRGKASATVQLVDPEIRAEPPETLAIAVASPTGEMLPGSFSRVERPPGFRAGAALYHFTLDESGGKPPGDDLTGERMITLYKLLGRQARIIPKVDFLFSHPAEIQQHGWAGFLRKLWPSARIIHIGPRSVALVEQE